MPGPTSSPPPPPDGSGRPLSGPASGSFGPADSGAGPYATPGSARFTPPSSGRYPQPSPEDLRQTIPDGPHRTPRADLTPYPSGAGTPPTSGGAPVVGKRRPLPPQVTERFEVLDELGRGGMGVVYLVHDRQRRERLALKVLIGQLNPKRLRRLGREAQATQTLDHPGIVPLVDASLDPAAPWLAYRLITDARTLSEAMESLPLPRRLQVVIDVARAAGHAHARGVVHRDLKAENVLLDPADRAYLTDFGVAALAGADRLTRSGAMVGTPHAMAPEQLKGERDKVGPRTDVWALGVLLYHALTDREPFTGATLGDLGVAIRGETPPPPRRLRPELAPELDAICRRCLEKEPERRYSDGAALAAALEALLEHAVYRPTGGGWVKALALAAGCALAAFGLGRLSAPRSSLAAASELGQATGAGLPEGSSPSRPPSHPPSHSAPLARPPGQAPGGADEPSAAAAVGDDPSSAQPSPAGGPLDSDPLALAELERRVAGGSPELRLPLARRLLLPGPTRDPRRAVRLLEVAVRDEVPGARSALARLLSYGWGVGRQRGRARDLLLEDAPSRPGAWLEVAHLYLTHAFGRDQEGQAQAYVERAHEAGVLGATRILGYTRAVNAEDRAEATRGAELVRQAAEGGDPLAACAMAHLCQKGVGVPADAAAAERWRLRFGEAVNGDLDSDALFALSLGLHFGVGVPKDVLIPRQILAKLIQRGFAPALDELATCQLTGCGGPRDPQAAGRLIEEAAAADLIPARLRIARVAMFRREDYARARQLLSDAYEAGSHEAAALLGSLHYDGRGGPRDYDAARQILELGRDGYDGDCLRNLALMLERGHGGPQDVEGALELYRRAARLGHAVAARRLAQIYGRGLHERQDLAQARSYARLGSQLQDSESEVILARLLAYGQGGPARPADALLALRRAMERGHPPAGHLFAILHLDEVAGIPRDDPAARRALEGAAGAGYEPALVDLARVLIEARGGPRDLPRAERLLRQAARQDPRAQRRLAERLLDGTFSSANPDEAREWLRRAAAAGDERAQRLLEELAPR